MRSCLLYFYLQLDSIFLFSYWEGTCPLLFLDVKTKNDEVLREGELGGEHVSIEDRLIGASLRAYDGAEKEEVRELFLTFAIFPEDVPIPRGLFDCLAGPVFGAGGKRPHLKVRSWLTALLRLSLLQGSVADGVYQHDIVLAYVRSHCTDLQERQRRFVEALLGPARPESGWPPVNAASRQTVEWYMLRSFIIGLNP